MPSDIYQSIAASLDGQLTLPSDDLTTARNKMNALHYRPLAAGTTVEWRDFKGSSYAIVSSASLTEPHRYLLYIHGGAFIAGDGEGFLFYAEMLSEHFNATVALVDYRLAPEHRFPAALNDCCRVYQALLEQGVPAKSIGFIGDSCGGGLVLSSLFKLRDEGADLPSCGLSLCGWLDLASDSPDKDPLYDQGYTHRRGLDYAGDADLTQAYISPLYGELDKLPPLLLQVGESDPTRKHAEALLAKAKAAKQAVSLELSTHMPHGFHGFAAMGMPESLQALQRARHFYDSCLKH
ncbi:alpha/beta hydrolase fold domain-containing protein [Parahaliea sp. F7430]|uniref:Alpha/beta hydrolase fold domain-containing protein n=1 Tax=Sediminihaliea albiluteola TaxID=2758564 RepID=A0A7W2TWT3_9GAMM|nr:alpha/beta hydrolase fold domain-containing protein [Sediminihaliea albiluteola]MBA6413372.1 alpha/beta hydrolase fold domain-containing protein [Sediminihaliea albiluteola]